MADEDDEGRGGGIFDVDGILYIWAAAHLLAHAMVVLTKLFKLMTLGEAS